MKRTAKLVFKGSIVLLILFYFLFPKTVSAKSYQSSATPTWVKVTYFTAIALSLGKWCWDSFFKENASKIRFTEADSSSFAYTYLLKGDSLSRFKALPSEKERQRYIRSYWKQFDPYPFDAKNELRDEFEYRINRANKSFSTPNKKGWRSDKGRIILLYGPADDVEVFPFESSIYKHPHTNEYTDMEIWLYDKPGERTDIPLELKGLTGGRMFFLFTRLSGTDVYKQVYSSELGELNDNSLFERITGNE